MDTIHELHPRGCQHIEDGDGLKRIACQQFEADRAGIGRKHGRFVGIGIFQWHIFFFRLEYMSLGWKASKSSTCGYSVCLL